MKDWIVVLGTLAVIALMLVTAEWLANRRRHARE